MEITESHKHETYGHEIFEYRLQVKFEIDPFNVVQLIIEGENKSQAIQKMVDTIENAIKKLNEVKDILKNM